jgi:catechol 2,3-dioxygenase-like lactoylglutathione lyase family enzyme
MERVPARMGIVTLGVSDLKRSIAFYRDLGWQRCDSSIDGTISWFRTADGYLGLFPYEELAADARVDAPTRGSFGGMTLAINVETVEGVGVALDAAVGAGGTLLKPATELPFGVSGYFADPDGYVWEVAYNPSFPIADDGRLTIA